MHCKVEQIRVDRLAPITLSSDAQCSVDIGPYSPYSHLSRENMARDYRSDLHSTLQNNPKYSLIDDRQSVDNRQTDRQTDRETERKWTDR